MEVTFEKALRGAVNYMKGRNLSLLWAGENDVEYSLMFNSDKTTSEGATVIFVNRDTAKCVEIPVERAQVRYAVSEIIPKSKWEKFVK